MQACVITSKQNINKQCWSKFWKQNSSKVWSSLFLAFQLPGLRFPVTRSVISMDTAVFTLLPTPSSSHPYCRVWKVAVAPFSTLTLMLSWCPSKPSSAATTDFTTDSVFLPSSIALTSAFSLLLQLSELPRYITLFAQADDQPMRICLNGASSDLGAAPSPSTIAVQFRGWRLRYYWRWAWWEPWKANEGLMSHNQKKLVLKLLKCLWYFGQYNGFNLELERHNNWLELISCAAFSDFDKQLSPLVKMLTWRGCLASCVTLGLEWVRENQLRFASVSCATSLTWICKIEFSKLCRVHIESLSLKHICGCHQPN